MAISNTLYERKNGIYLLCKIDESRSELYNLLRENERRVFTVYEVKNLPKVDSSHPHFKEWKVKEKSFKRIISYLSTTNKKRILDLGCGYGWFSAKLASKFPERIFFAVDINKKELEIGAEAFQLLNLYFILGDIFLKEFDDYEFDVIILNSSVQYFPDIDVLLNRLKKLLSDQGEIHIIDSPFYSKKELISAKERTKKYYENQGFVEMEKYYFHHSYANLEKENWTFLYKPSILKKIFNSKNSPFPWVRITN